MPFLFIYSPDDFVEGLPAESGAQAAGTPPFTLTLKPDATPTLIEVSDDDTIFDEVDATQNVASTISFGGATIPAGTTINSAYDLINTVSGHQVTSFHFGGDGFQQGAVDGLASTVELVPGTSYTFNTERTSHLQDNPYVDFVSCFTAGTRIATPNGPVLVEDLRKGDLVLTSDHGAQPVRAVLSRAVTLAELEANANLTPVMITAGALGANLPAQDLCVSPQHRMLVASPIVERMFGTAQALVSARKLCGLPGIFPTEARIPITYFHLVFDRHEVIFANGAPTESLYAGPGALAALSPEAAEELRTLFPELFQRHGRPSSARFIPSGKQQRRLAFRHEKNGKPLVMAGHVPQPAPV
ncbi:Hint domain-containing protein [Tropicimonas sp. S265A]|uniref:Hint domain-containing protein n=1 Tax=Tropicimonas sp. S265A TaxID=3415134 RepID=UPI003C7D00C2